MSLPASQDWRSDAILKPISKIPPSDFQFFGSFHTEIVGRRHYPCGRTICGRFFFQREPANPHDANAVEVYNAEEELMGHLSKDFVRMVAGLMSGGFLFFEGHIHGGLRSDDYKDEVVINCFSLPQYFPKLTKLFEKMNVNLSEVEFKNGDGESEAEQPLLTSQSEASGADVKEEETEAAGPVVKIEEVAVKVEDVVKKEEVVEECPGLVECLSTPTQPRRRPIEVDSTQPSKRIKREEN